MNEPECGNPLLLRFLKEWWDLAKERSSKGATVYRSLSCLPLLSINSLARLTTLFKSVENPVFFIFFNFFLGGERGG